MLAAQAAGRTGKAQKIESTFKPGSMKAAQQSEAAHRIHDRRRE
jgi:hypothetical protein